MEEQPTNVTSLESYRPESINGVVLTLGKLNPETLFRLADACRTRRDDAQHELSVVLDEIERRYPDGKPTVEDVIRDSSPWPEEPA